ELTAAAPQLQPAVYGLLQERRVGPHTLPPSVFVVAAGNGAEDGAVAYEMGSALADRLVHLRVEASAQDWLDNFAVPHGLHPAITAFLRIRPDLLETIPQALDRGQVIACTPRSWHRAAQILAAVPDRTAARVMLAGTLGEAVAAEFQMIADDIAATVDAGRLLAATGRERTALYPASMHGLHALIHALVGGLGPDNAAASIAAMADIRQLDRLRPDAPAFARMPLAELATHGFEMLIRQGLAKGLADAFLDHPAYAAHAAERRAMGLE
ncbi:MAG: ATPase, partial [Gemmobacter sp.]